MKKFSIQDSVHNKLYGLFVFRTFLIEEFETSLKNAKGRLCSKTVTIPNVIPSHAEALFSYIQMRLKNENLPEKLLEFTDSHVKDILFRGEDRVRGVAVPFDSIIKVSHKSLKHQTIAINVPYPNLLHGFLSSHFNKFPVGVSQQRSGIGSLACSQWDYIPNVGGVIHFEYNFLTQFLTASFNIKTDLNKNILNQMTPKESISTIIAKLVDKTFQDQIFGWDVVIKFVI